jgi:hypothetical protein
MFVCLQWIAFDVCVLGYFVASGSILSNLNQEEQLNRLANWNFFLLFEDKEAYFVLVFNYLRFDRHNLPLLQKRKLAEVFVRFMSQNVPKEQEDGLSALRGVFKYLYAYCIAEPLS